MPFRIGFGWCARPPLPSSSVIFATLLLPFYRSHNDAYQFPRSSLAYYWYPSFHSHWQCLSKISLIYSRGYQWWYIPTFNVVSRCGCTRVTFNLSSLYLKFNFSASNYNLRMWQKQEVTNKGIKEWMSLLQKIGVYECKVYLWHLTASTRRPLLIAIVPNPRVYDLDLDHFTCLWYALSSSLAFIISCDNIMGFTNEWISANVVRISHCQQQ